MKNYLPIIFLLGCAAFLAVGVVELFELRFEAGDVYPAYSSLRADPLGTMAFYESLGKMPGISVRRDFSISNRLPEDPDTVYLQLAAKTYEWSAVPDDLFREIKNFLGRGGRLVIAFFPQTSAHHFNWGDEEGTNAVKSAHLKSKETNAPPANPAKRMKRKGDTRLRVDLEEEWGFHQGFEELAQDGRTYVPVSVANKSSLPLPPSLNWHSGMVFTNCDAAWRTIYGRSPNAVMIERKFGIGSVVLASDSYFLSNEAMLKDRQAAVLAWLIGRERRVVFDEAHLGISESPGVAALMRKYRLHSLAAGLLLLAGLFIWKNSTSLVPPHRDEQREDFVAGKDAASGFVNLLRRSVRRREILEVCFAEWKKSAAPSGKFSRARLQQAEAIFQAEHSLPPRDRDPIAAYKKISETLNK